MIKTFLTEVAKVTDFSMVKTMEEDEARARDSVQHHWNRF